MKKMIFDTALVRKNYYYCSYEQANQNTTNVQANTATTQLLTEIVSSTNKNNKNAKHDESFNVTTITITKFAVLFRNNIYSKVINMLPDFDFSSFYFVSEMGFEVKRHRHPNNLNWGSNCCNIDTERQ